VADDEDQPEPAEPAESPEGPAVRRPASPRRRAKTEPLARLALVLAVAAVLIPPGTVAIAALAAAAKASRRIRSSPMPERGLRAVALARVLAVLAVFGWVAFLVVVLPGLGDDEGVDYSELRVGDCIDVPESDDIEALDLVPCSEPHDAEVFGVLSHPAEAGAPYPGSGALVAFAGEACLGRVFTDYVGVPRDRSQLNHLEIVPQQSAWDDGRRQLVCAVDADAPLVGSVRGSGR